MADAAPVYQFINATYIKEKYEKNGNHFEKVADDALIIAYKKDGEQKIQVIENPKYSFRVAKQGIQLQNNVDNIPITDTDIVTIFYHDLVKTLAQINGKEEAYFRLKRDRSIDYQTKRAFENQLQMNPRLFGSDIPIEDQYKINFVDQYGVNIGGYKKAVFDIETDGKGNGVIDPHEAKDPINCISFYDFTTQTMYTLVWDRPDIYPTFEAFRAEVNSGAFEQRLRNNPDMNGETDRKNNI